MILRAMMPRDLEQVRSIHEKYYGQEFSLPDFVTNYLCAFVVLDEDGSIISAGGVRAILESVLITDKSYDPGVRKEALLHILGANLHCAQRGNYEGIHAFVQDKKWAERLKRTGFKPAVGEALYLGIK